MASILAFTGLSSTIKILIAVPHVVRLNFDGVVKSPLYCVAVIFQNLNIRCMPDDPENHYALYMEHRTTPSIGRP